MFRLIITHNMQIPKSCIQTICLKHGRILPETQESPVGLPHMNGILKKPVCGKDPSMRKVWMWKYCT